MAVKHFFLSALFLILLSGIAFGVPPERIISLAPNVTEMLYALGLEERIIAVTSFCDFPPQVRQKPRIGGMSNPSLEAIISFKPDIVIMTTDGNPREVEARLHKLGIRTYVLTATRISGLSQEVRGLGRILDVQERAEQLAGKIDRTMSMYRAETGEGEKKKAIFIIWPEPLVVAGQGTAVDDVLNLLGWQNIASDARARYPKYSLEEIIIRAPDVIFIGKGHADMSKLSEGILKRLGMLDAVRMGRVYYTSDALYRLGPRVLEGTNELAGFLRKVKTDE